MIAMVVFYLVVVMVVGLMAGRLIKSSASYYLGGKSFGPWLTAFHFASTWESGVKLVGTPGMAWNVGYPAFVQGLVGPLGYFFSFRVFGQRLKAACDYFNVITVPQLLEKRYSSRLVRVLGAITILVGLGGSLVAQNKATGEAFSQLLGVTYVEGVIVGVLIVGIYSIVGGFIANVWTDFVQGIVMIFGSIALFVGVAQAAFGGVSPGIMAEINAGLAQVKPQLLEITGGGKMPAIQMILVLIISLLIGIALPQQAVAIFSMRDVRVARSALIIATFFSAIIVWCVLPAGMMGHFLLTKVPNPDAVIPMLVVKFLHPVMAGLFMGAIIAAIMSTADSIIMVTASAISQDIMNIVCPGVYQKNPVLWDRIAAAVMVVIPLIIAIKPPSIIFWIIVFSFGFVVFTFLMPMIGVILWRRGTTHAAIAQMAVTMVLIPVWAIFGKYLIPSLPALALGLIVAPIVFIAVSLLARPTNREVVDNLIRSCREWRPSTAPA